MPVTSIFPNPTMCSTLLGTKSSPRPTFNLSSAYAPDSGNGYVGKQPVAWNEYCPENWLKEPQESMDRWTGRRDVTEILKL